MVPPTKASLTCKRMVVAQVQRYKTARPLLKAVAEQETRVYRHSGLTLLDITGRHGKTASENKIIQTHLPYLLRWYIVSEWAFKVYRHGSCFSRPAAEWAPKPSHCTTGATRRPRASAQVCPVYCLNFWGWHSWRLSRQLPRRESEDKSTSKQTTSILHSPTRQDLGRRRSSAVKFSAVKNIWRAQCDTWCACLRSVPRPGPLQRLRGLKLAWSYLEVTYSPALITFAAHHIRSPCTFANALSLLGVAPPLFPRAPRFAAKKFSPYDEIVSTVKYCILLLLIKTIFLIIKDFSIVILLFYIVNLALHNKL